MSLRVDIKKRFKGFTLDVQFTSDGTSLGILGPSGSGKSMTLKSIAGIETPDEGYIEVNGKVLFNSSKKINVKPPKRRIGYLFQNYALFPNMTVQQNVGCAIHENKPQKEKKIQALLEQYQLTGLENRFPSQLSGGQQQRVALARILAYEPQILLLDEPFSALDAHLKESLQIDMMHLLKHYPGDAVMVTHNRDEVYRLCKQLMVLDEGRVQAMGNSHDMFKNPKTFITARLTGCKNFSKARPLSSNTVYAEDWGCELQVLEPIPSNLTHIGVRAHFFTPCTEGSVNAIEIALKERLESPFEWDVLFQNAAFSQMTENIWWKYPKESSIAALPQYLAVSPENILLLESSD